MKQKLIVFFLSVSLGFWGLGGVALAGTPSLYASASGNSVISIYNSPYRFLFICEIIFVLFFD